MTESAAYPAASLAILAIVLAVERPSVRRQLAVLGAVALAFLTRAQFAALFPAYVAALALLWIVVPAQRPRDRRAVRALWPTLTVVAVGSRPRRRHTARQRARTGGPAVRVRRALGRLRPGRGREAGRLPPRRPRDLSRRDPGRGLPDRPLAAPAGARERDRWKSGAFASTFLAVNTCLVLVAAAFASTAAGFGHLHDRYLFYVVPLWLVVLAVWLRDGLPRPVVATSLGAALALVLPALTPFELIAAEDGAGGRRRRDVPLVGDQLDAFETFPDEISGDAFSRSSSSFSCGRHSVAPKRLRVGLARGRRDRARRRDRGRLARLGADGRGLRGRASGPPNVGGRGRRGRAAAVTSLYVSAECDRAPWTANALLLTEFFNRAVSAYSARRRARPEPPPVDGRPGLGRRHDRRGSPARPWRPTPSSLRPASSSAADRLATGTTAAARAVAGRRACPARPGPLGRGAAAVRLRGRLRRTPRLGAPLPSRG